MKINHSPQLTSNHQHIQKRIGLLVDDNRHISIGILGSFIADAVLIPLSINLPIERLNHIINDSEITIVVTEKKQKEIVNSLINCSTNIKHFIFIDEIPDNISSKENIYFWNLEDYKKNDKFTIGKKNKIKEKSQAYIVYTSGSSGKPKGVAISHANLLPVLLWSKEYLGLGRHTKALKNLNYCFDFGLYEILTTLIAGGTLYYSGTKLLASATKIQQYIRKNHINTIHTTPIIFNRVFSGRKSINSVTTVHIGADSLTREMLENIYQAISKKGRVFHGYGPTETTINATFINLGLQEENNYTNYSVMPIGTASASHKIMLLDERLNPVPYGVTGEIVISGESVSEGYINQAAKTAELFIPQENSQRCYRTGDLAKQTRDGNLLFCGRKDNQINWRGHRIDIGEIETIIISSNLVNEVALSLENEDLYAYLKINELDKFDLSKFLDYLFIHMPVYQVPTKYYHVPRIEVNENGKFNINKTKLSAQEILLSKLISNEESIIENKLLKIWCEILERDDISTTDDFFMIGGDSLNGSIIISRINECFSCSLTLINLFKLRTIKRISILVDQEKELINKKVWYNNIDILRKQYMRYHEGKNLWPVSGEQARLYFLNQLLPESNQYLISSTYKIQGNFSLGLVRCCMLALVVRHKQLRSAFLQTEDNVYQYHLPIELFDVKIIKSNENQEKITTKQYFNQTFTCLDKPLFKISILTEDKNEFYLNVCFHHIIADGWSLGIIVDDFMSLYEEGMKNSELRNQYKAYEREDVIENIYENASKLNDLCFRNKAIVEYTDYCCWLKENIFSKKSIRFWIDSLTGSTATINLPKNLNTGNYNTNNDVGRIKFHISSETANNLHQFANESNTTLYVVLLSAFSFVMSRYANQRDFNIGTPVANRNRKETENLVGLFVNTLVLRLKIDLYDSFDQAVEKISHYIFTAFEHAIVPFDEVVKELNPERNINATPLFEVFFILQNYPTKNFSLSGLNLKNLDNDENSAKFNITCTMTDFGSGLYGEIDYKISTYKKSLIDNLIKDFQFLLSKVKIKNTLPITSLFNKNYNNLNKRYFQGKENDENSKNFIKEFQLQAISKKENIALEYNNISVTYQKLNEKSNCVANYLINIGIKVEDKIAVVMDRKPQMIFTIMGIIKSGATYLMCHNINSSEELQNIVDKEKISLIISDRNIKIDIKKIIDDKKLSDLIDDGDNTNPPVRSHPENIAVIFRTSGSTGLPKSVGVTHKGIASLFHWAKKKYTKNDYNSAAFCTSMNFDISIFELFFPLSIGGKVVLFENVLAMRNYAKPLTLISATPSHLKIMLDEKILSNSVRLINSAGEAISHSLVKRLFKETNITILHNLYGPTETTIYSSCASFTRDQFEKYEDSNISIGTALDNSSIYVLDRDLNPSVSECFGEIFISGEGVSRGYINDPATTALHFLPDPYSIKPGQRMYRSKDLGRFNHHNQLEYTGRIGQVQKVRGVWINLNELSFAINSCPEVSSAVVIVNRSTDEELIVAFYTCRKNKQATEEKIKVYLEDNHINFHRIITHYIKMDQFPLLDTGKINIEKLQSYDIGKTLSDRIGEPAKDAMTIAIADIWRSILQVENIYLNDNFFHLGGHSLTALRLIHHIENLWKVKPNITLIFEYPLLGDFSSAIRKLKSEGKYTIASEKIKSFPRREVMPASVSQRRLWFLAQLNSHANQYNVISNIKIDGELNHLNMIKAIFYILDNHEVFKSYFSFDNDELSVIVDKSVIHTINLIDYVNSSNLKKLTKNLNNVNYFYKGNISSKNILKSFIEKQSKYQFNLSSAPLIKIDYLRVSENDTRLLINQHHLITDAKSINLLIRQMQRVYIDLQNSIENTNLDNTIQYIDYAYWQKLHDNKQEYQKKINYWKKKLHGSKQYLTFPTDYQRPNYSDYSADNHGLLIHNSKINTTKQFFNKLNISSFMGFLGIFKILIFKYTASSDINVGFPISNRVFSELDDVLGFFVDTLVIRTQFNSNTTVKHFYNTLRDTCLEAYRNQGPSLDDIVSYVETERAVNFEPLFQLAFNYIQEEKPEKNTTNLNWQLIDSNSNSAKFDINCFCTDTKKGLVVSFEYKQSLFKKATIIRMLNDFSKIIGQVSLLENLSDIHLFSDNIRNKNPFQWNNTYKNHNCNNHLLFSQFEKQAKKNPNNIAIKTQNKEYSYREINSSANVLARELLKSGLKIGDSVAICLNRNAQLIISLLAVVKAGGVFIPLNGDIPSDRFFSIIQKNKINYLISNGTTLRKISNQFAETLVIEWLYDWENFGDYNNLHINKGKINTSCSASSNNISLSIAEEAAAYIIFTSGSTGTPKGVTVQHFAAFNTLQWVNTHHKVSSKDRLLWTAAAGFDLSIYDIFGTLSTGACICIADEFILQDPIILASYLNTWDITIWDSAPAAFEYLLLGCKNYGSNYCVNNLRLILLSGDKIPEKLPFSAKNYFPNAKVCALGGATEASIWSNFYDIPNNFNINKSSSHKLIPYGKPINNSHYYILDDALNPCPIGVEGDLYISGECLSLGYYHSPSLTAKNFIPNPYNVDKKKSYSRIYRTGDRASYDTQPIIYIHGRRDKQVKIRGFRVELEEIESHLNAYPLVTRSLALYDDKKQQLVAFIEIKPQTKFCENELKIFLNKRIPYYMLPSNIIDVDLWPMTDNGKINQQVLLELKNRRHKENNQLFTNLLTPTERQVQTICEKIFIVDNPDIDENFFSMGADSLLLISFMHSLRNAFKVKIEIMDVYKYHSIRFIARHITEQEKFTNSANNEKIIFCWQTGIKNTPSLVFIPPYLGDASCYGALITSLSKEYKGGIYTINFSDELLIQWQQQENCNFLSMAKLLAHHLSKKVTNEVFLCGWSLGGALAIAMQPYLKSNKISVRDPILLMDSYGKNPYLQELSIDQSGNTILDIITEEFLLKPWPANKCFEDKLNNCFEALISRGYYSSNYTVDLFKQRLIMLESLLLSYRNYTHSEIQYKVSLLESKKAKIKANSSWKISHWHSIVSIDADHYDLLNNTNIDFISQWCLKNITANCEE